MQPDHDIRGFLLVPGTSLKHGAPTSQVVDAAWGSEGWDVTEARHELRPFKGKKVLFAGPRPNDLLVSYNSPSDVRERWGHEADINRT
jgi:hypothetical protein